MFVITNPSNPNAAPPLPTGKSHAEEPGAAGGERSGTKLKFMPTSGAENMWCATWRTLIFAKVEGGRERRLQGECGVI